MPSVAVVIDALRVKSKTSLGFKMKSLVENSMSYSTHEINCGIIFLFLQTRKSFYTAKAPLFSVKLAVFSQIIRLKIKGLDTKDIVGFEQLGHGY